MSRRTRKPVHMTRFRGRIEILCYLHKGLRHPTEEVLNRVDFVLQLPISSRISRAIDQVLSWFLD